MSRHRISLLVLAIASLVVSACGTASTAPRNSDSTIVTSGTGG